MNKHIEHLEDIVLTGSGTTLDDLERLLINYIDNNESYHTSIKYDGSISVVFGIHPKDNKFFLSTKSFFNKKPKYATSRNQIKKLFNGEIVDTLEQLWDSLSPFVHQGIQQGDIMWTPKMKEQQKTGFKPNVVNYLIHNADFSNIFQTHQFGIVVHTSYDKNLNSSSVTSSILKQNSIGSTFIFAPERVSIKYMSSAHRELYKEVWTNLLHEFDHYYMFPLSKQHQQLMKMFVNATIKYRGNHYIDFLNVEEFFFFLKNQKQTKHVVSLRKDLVFKFKYTARFEAYRQTSLLKHYLINLLQNQPSKKILYPIINSINSHEGFVIDAQINDSPMKIKLVDRTLFSYENFKKHGEVING